MRKERQHYLIQKMIAILVFSLLSFISTASAEEYKQYCNARFGFCVVYPAGFGVSPASDNNDGREFYDREGFTMTASGMHNVLESTLRAEMKSQEEDFDTVTYRKVKSNWYVLSGHKGDNILYIKTYVGRETIYHLYLRYPVSLKKEYDKTVSKVAQSFKPAP